MTRILTLLLITQATADWVEISQQHYTNRKPTRTQTPLTRQDEVIDDEDTSKPWTYDNRSVNEYNWNKNPARQPSIGNVKRVQQTGSVVKTTERVKLEDDDIDLHVDFRDFELRPNYGPTKATTESHDKQKGKIERVSNVGNIKRVQLSDTPVKSPVINNKVFREKYSPNRHDNSPRDEDDRTEANEFEHKKNTEAYRRIYVNQVKNPYETVKTATFPPDDEDDTSFVEETTTFNKERPKQEYKNRTAVKASYSTKPTFITEDFSGDEAQQSRFYKITNSKSSEVTEKINVYTPEIIHGEEAPKLAKPLTTIGTIELHEKQKSTIQRVSNKGNIKRVELYNSPVKSPTDHYKGDRQKYSNNRHQNNPHDDDHHTEANEFQDNKKKEGYRRIYVNEVKNSHDTVKTATFPPDDDNDSTSIDDEVTSFKTERPKQGIKSQTTGKHFYSTKPTFITETEDFTNYETQQNRFYKIINSKSSEVTDKINVFTTEIIDTEDEVTKTSTKVTTPAVKANKNNFHKNVNTFKSESHRNETPENSMVNDHKTKFKGNNDDQPNQDQQSVKENKDANDEVPTATKMEKNKVSTIENLVKFMRVVADTISKNSRRSVGGKMQYLHELKESILANIEERIDATWPDDDSAGARRRSRSAHASPRGHVHLASSESALMTISFLTFAVFLIKLVLQVIHTYKQKAMMVAPVVVASGRKVFSQHHGHH